MIDGISYSTRAAQTFRVDQIDANRKHIFIFLFLAETGVHSYYACRTAIKHFQRKIRIFNFK